MAGSQLTQLKSALSGAGLNRKTHSKKEKKEFKRGGGRETDRVKTLAKLEDIRKSLNKFDERETKVKHDVGGRNLKGVTGRPSASKQAGLEQRKKSLLPEHQLKGHTGTFRDRRFGESDADMSLEDRMLERYTRERQRGQGKKGMFNLEDEDDNDLDGFDEGTALGGLTHGGRSVMDLQGDDFVAQGMGGDEDDEDEREGRIAQRVVGRTHFGGFDEDVDEEGEPRKKSKSEVMSEIITKSKEHKYERQQQKELDDNLRDELDDDIDGLREMLQTGTRPDRKAPSALAAGPSRPRLPPGEIQDTDYDQYVRSLAYEARAKPKDRTKTEDEMAIDEAEKLQKAEAKRQRRMRGEDVSDEEDAEEGGYKKRRKLEKRGDADDLDDDFVDDDDLLGPGITRDQLEHMGKMNGGADDEAEDGGSDEEDDDEENSGEEDGEGDDDDEDEDREDDEDGEDDEDDDEEDSEGAMSAMEDLDDDALELGSAEDNDEEPVVRKSKGKQKAKGEAVKEIPYTFPCPSSIDEFEDILENLDDSALPTVVQRIRAIHHPSLAQGNKEKLQDFLGVLLDYILILASRTPPSFDLIQQITPHILALVKLNPLSASSHFVSKITLMQKNLARGLSRGAASADSKTYPRCPELVFLRLTGVVWSTSDYSNPVVVPAVLLMSQYLAQSRIRGVADVASGLFLCSILAQYEAESKRLIPEAVNFVGSALLALLPRRKDAKPSTTFPDIAISDLSLALSTSSATPNDPADLAAALVAEDDDEQSRADLISVAFKLATTYASLYNSLESFIELFSPILRVLEGSRVAKLSQPIKDLHASTKDGLSRTLKFARQARTPLAMQAHKPVPIKTYAPKFEDDFAPGRHYDPDTERNSSAKVKALYKKERKGAIRELRKDNRFLAGEKAREQNEKDKAYTARMRHVEGGLNVERAEEKEMQREKQREKRRAGRG